MENKHEKIVTYHVLATLILLPCSSILCPKIEVSGGKIPLLHGRPCSKTRVCADLQSVWTSLTHTLYVFSSWFCKLNINFFPCSLSSWCLVISLKKWQQLLGLQGHVFKAQHINQSSSMSGLNPTSQKQGKKGVFWCSLWVFFPFQKWFRIWFIMFPLGFLARLRKCPCNSTR